MPCCFFHTKDCHRLRLRSVLSHQIGSSHILKNRWIIGCDSDLFKNLSSAEKKPRVSSCDSLTGGDNHWAEWLITALSNVLALNQWAYNQLWMLFNERLWGYSSRTMRSQSGSARRPTRVPGRTDHSSQAAELLTLADECMWWILFNEIYFCAILFFPLQKNIFVYLYHCECLQDVPVYWCVQRPVWVQHVLLSTWKHSVSTLLEAPCDSFQKTIVLLKDVMLQKSFMTTKNASKIEHLYDVLHFLIEFYNILSTEGKQHVQPSIAPLHLHEGLCLTE